MRPLAHLALVLCLAAPVACRDPSPSARFRCECSVLTDTDGLTSHAIELCAATLDRALEAASGCAQAGAPAAVQSCRCEPVAAPAEGGCARPGCLPGEG